MYPYLHFGSLRIPTFGLMLWFAAVCAGYVLYLNFRRARVQADAISIVAYVTILGIVGAFIWNRLQHPVEYAQFLHGQFAILVTHMHMAGVGFGQKVFTLVGDLLGFLPRDGFAWYGGLLAGVATLMWEGRKAGVGALGMLDLSAPAAAIGYGVGRIGCLTSGDGDYGINTTLPWGVHMAKDALVPPNPPSAAVQPTPIYELLFSLLVFWILWRLGRRSQPVGWLTGLYLVLAGAGRFLVEFVRINPPLYFGLTNAQVASIGSVIAGGALMVWTRRHQEVIEAAEHRVEG
jgi:phosphatidylglycerol:prolipoprotein diacylglycerol transferase